MLIQQYLMKLLYNSTTITRFCGVYSYIFKKYTDYFIICFHLDFCLEIERQRRATFHFEMADVSKETESQVRCFWLLILKLYFSMRKKRFFFFGRIAKAYGFHVKTKLYLWYYTWLQIKLFRRKLNIQECLFRDWNDSRVMSLHHWRNFFF